jgi:hypothetical protein
MPRSPAWGHERPGDHLVPTHTQLKVVAAHNPKTPAPTHHLISTAEEGKEQIFCLLSYVVTIFLKKKSAMNSVN